MPGPLNPASPVAGYNNAMRYRLRTLLIVLAIGPALLAGFGWKWLAYQQRYACNRHLIEIGIDPKTLSQAP